jgi:hypothetical protein
VYFTVVEVAAVKVPQALPEQDDPETVHVTPWFDESFATVARRVTDCDDVKPKAEGVTATLICACGCAGSGMADTGGSGLLAWNPPPAVSKPLNGNAMAIGIATTSKNTRPSLRTEFCIVPDCIIAKPPNAIEIG